MRYLSLMKVVRLMFVSLLSLSFVGCDLLSSLSDADIASGLKEALRVSTDTSVAKTNRTDGYFGNAVIKILLPEEAVVVQSSVGLIPGGQALVDEVILKMNRAAEQAAAEATPIFVDAITGVTFQDARQILEGDTNAATLYLEGNTRTQLYGLFKPKVEDALASVGIQTAWNSLINGYNAIPLVPDINPDLADHTTQKALDGLFYMLALEEAKIRTNVSHQVSDLLRQVFGGN
jgi:hypothetical protein